MDALWNTVQQTDTALWILPGEVVSLKKQMASFFGPWPESHDTIGESASEFLAQFIQKPRHINSSLFQLKPLTL